MNVEVLEAIEADSSRLAKEALLPKLDEGLRRFVKLALDPDVTFGVTVDEDEAVKAVPTRWSYSDEKAEKPFTWDLEKFLDLCSERKLTGDAAKEQMWRVIRSAPSALHAKWTARIINRNLRAGFDIRTFNSVFGQGAVEKFEVQLAEAYEDQELGGLWFFQPKLDGNRVVFIDGEARSRSGKYYPNCEHVVKEILAKDPKFFDKWVLDGEMMGDLGFDESSGALRRQSQKDRKKATFTYYAFDLIERKEWAAQKTRNLVYRDSDIRQVIDPLKLTTVRLVPTTRLHDPTHKQVMDICREYVAQGFEGAMAKDSASPYRFKRADNILKVKLFSEADFRIVPGSFYTGNGRNKGTLGGFYIEGEMDWSPPGSGKPAKHYKVYSKCGGGFSDPMRKLIWGDQKGWGGAMATIEFFEPTKKVDEKGRVALRFPVFMMRRKDKE